MPEQDYNDRLKDYVQVKDRIVALYELFGAARIETTYELTREPDDKPKVICRAIVYRTPDDPHPSTGTSWMNLPGTTPYTKGSEIENAETSAIGRAIGFLGILIDKSIASANEIAGKEEGPTPERNIRADVAARDAAPANGGLIGTAEKNEKMTSDYALRMSPDGAFIGFRIKDGIGPGVLAEAHGPLAEALALVEADVIGQRVQVWGRWVEHVMAGNKGKWKAISIDRIVTPSITLPAQETGGPSQTEVAGVDGEQSAPAAPDPEIDALPLFQDTAA